MADPLSPAATGAQRASGPGMQTTLPSRPAAASTAKKPRLPPGARILTRVLNTSRPTHHNPKITSGAAVTRADPYLAPKRRIVIRRGTSLVAILKRVQKLLDKSPGGALSMGLADVMASRKKGKTAGGGGAGSTKKGGTVAASAGDDGVQVRDDRFPVVVLGAGALNIEKALKTAAVFQRRGDCVVRIYTSTVSGVDTYEVDEDEEDGERMEHDHDAGADADTEMSGKCHSERASGGGRTQVGKTTVVKQRSRKASALEVAIRLKT